MNIRLGLLLLCSGGLCGVTRTVLVPRSVSTDPTLELAMTYHHELQRQLKGDEFSWSVYAKPLFESSTKAYFLAQYLLPRCGCNNSCLSVREDGLGNIGSPWLYLLAQPGSQFNSSLCMCPRYIKAGVLLDFRFNFDRFIRGLWLSASVAPLVAQNRLCLCENPYGAAGSLSGYSSVIQALNSYGTSTFCNRKSKVGVDDIQLKLGYTFNPHERWVLEAYLAGIIPTSNRQRSCYFFEPQVGNGRHSGLGGGLMGQLIFHEGERGSLSLLYDAKYLYLFKHCQTRVFDLCNGDWSRYLLGAFQEAPSIGLPLLKSLTRSCQVTPRSQASLWAAFHAQYRAFQLEVGGNFWWRQQELVGLGCRGFGSNVGIFDLAGALVGTPVSASRACIYQTAGGDNVAPSDTTFTSLGSSAVNVCSATQPQAYTGKAYAALGAEANDWRYPFQASFGGFYEWSNRCAALNMWGAWASLGFQF